MRPTPASLKSNQVVLEPVKMDDLSTRDAEQLRERCLDPFRRNVHEHLNGEGEIHRIVREGKRGRGPRQEETVQGIPAPASLEELVPAQVHADPLTVKAL